MVIGMDESVAVHWFVDNNYEWGGYDVGIVYCFVSP